MTPQVSNPVDVSGDLVKVFEPHERQNDFLKIPDTIFEALYGGAAYGGKSLLLVLLPLIRGFYKQRGFKGIILRRKFPDLEREIIRVSKEYYPHTGAVYNDQKHTWTWPWGAYMDFGHVQHMKDIKQYDGYQLNYCAYDELTHFEEGMYLYLVGSRVRPSNDFNISIVRNATNPGGIGQTFTYNRFVKPNENGYTRIVDKKTGLRRMFIPCLPSDNPYGVKYDPDYGNKLELLSEAEKQAKKYGNWHAFEGSVFPEFRPIKFPNEPDNAIHVIPYFNIPDWWPRIVAVDWGKAALCVALWGAISPDNRIYIYREMSWKGIDIPYWAREIGDISSGENIVDAVICGSAIQDRGTETVHEQVVRYSKMQWEISDNTPGSRISGKNLVHDFLRWKQLEAPEITLEFDEELAQHIFRNYGTEQYERYLSNFKPREPELNLPRLQILQRPNSDEPIAPLLTEVIPQLIYDEVRKEDVAEFDGDDPYDDLRYLLKRVNMYCNGELNEELIKRNKYNAILDELHRTGNQTAFYRNMEVLEQDVDDDFCVRRSRFGRR